MGADRDEDGVEATLLLLGEQVLDLVVLGEDDAQVAQAVDLGVEDLVREGQPRVAHDTYGRGDRLVHVLTEKATSICLVWPSSGPTSHRLSDVTPAVGGVTSKWRCDVAAGRARGNDMDC